jgi:hypothetical protein
MYLWLHLWYPLLYLFTIYFFFVSNWSYPLWYPFFAF